MEGSLESDSSYFLGTPNYSFAILVVVIKQNYVNNKYNNCMK